MISIDISWRKWRYENKQLEDWHTDIDEDILKKEEEAPGQKLWNP